MDDDGCILFASVFVAGLFCGFLLGCASGRSRVRADELEPALRALGPEHQLAREYAAGDEASEEFRRWVCGVGEVSDGDE